MSLAWSCFVAVPALVLQLFLVLSGEVNAHGTHFSHGPHRGGSMPLLQTHSLGYQPAKYVSLLIEDQCKSSISEVIEMDAKLTEVFPVTRPLKFDVTEYPFDPQDVGMLGVSDRIAKQRLLLTFVDGSGNEWGHVFLDPRIRYADGIHGSLHADVEPTGSAIPGSYYHTPRDVATFRLPRDASSIDVHCFNTSHSANHALTSRRRFMRSDVGDDDEFTVRNIQYVGPNMTQHSIIFLSGGYTADEEAEFDEAVDTAIRLLPDPDFTGLRSPNHGTRYEEQNFVNMRKSVPFDRYWASSNVFSVFQRSPESGASRPGIGQIVNDNLGCTHPASMERAISCEIEPSIALADLAPAPVRADPDRVLLIVIVNTRIYGGTGLMQRGRVHLGVFFNGFRGTETTRDEVAYASLINHEIGHAFGGLIDEYDGGESERPGIIFPNCHTPGPGGSIPQTISWQHWIDIASNPAELMSYRGSIQPPGEQRWDVSDTPLRICLFTNYFRASEFCMMNRLRDFFMCPVCREMSTLEMMKVPFELQWPRYPLPDNIFVIPTAAAASAADHSNIASVATGAILHLPAFLTVGNNFSVTWTLGTQILSRATDLPDCEQCLRLTRQMLEDEATFPHEQVVTINVTIVDGTGNFVSRHKRGEVAMLTQHTSFRVMVTDESLTHGGMLHNQFPIRYEEPIAPRKGHFGLALPEDNMGTYHACVAETPSRPPLCELVFTIKTYEAPEDLDALFSAYDQWVLYVAAGIAVFFFLLWVWAWHYYSSKSRGVVRPIFKTEFTGVVRLIRIIMKVSAILFMIGSLVSLGISVYFYTKTSALGKVAIFAGIPLSLGLYTMAFIGFWAVSYRSKRLLLINGGILFLGFIILIAICVLLVWVGTDIKKEDSHWTNYLRDLWIQYVRDDPARVCAIQGALRCSGFNTTCDGRSNIVSPTFCPSNCEETNQRFFTPCRNVIRDWIAQHYSTLLKIIIACIVMMFFAIVFNFVYYFKLMMIKKNIREQNNARVHRHASQHGVNARAADSCRALYILKTLDDGDIDSLKREFARIDTDGNGQLDRQEFLTFFKKALCYRPTKAEIDKIYAVADIDGDGTISLDEFLAIFRKSPQVRSAPSGGRAVPLRAGSDPNREAELQRRLATQFAQTGLVDEEMQGTPAKRPAPAPPPRQQQRAYRPPSDRPPTPPGLL